MWGNRVVIPRAGQNLVLQELHEAHPGATRMKQLARTLVWWPSIDQDIENTVKSCAECQTNQSSPTETLLPWQWPSRPWSRVHVDFMGPFMGHMILVLVDSHSKWIEAHVMSSVTSTLSIARNERTRSYVSVYLQYIFRLCICRKCIDAIERLVFTAATAIIVVAASDTHIEKAISG